MNLDVMPGLGLACRFDSFDYIDSMVAQSLIPVFMSIILGLAYFFLACTSSKKSKEEEAYELPRNLRRKFTIKELRGLKTLFRHFDVDGGGFIDAKEMAALTKRLGLETTLLRSSSAASAAGDPESAPDQEGGEVDFKGFAELVIKSRKGPGGSKVDFFRLADELELEAGLAAGMADLEVPSALLGVFKEKELKSYRDIFRRFDRDGSGVIASKEIAELIRCLNPDLPKEELAAMKIQKAVVLFGVVHPTVRSLAECRLRNPHLRMVDRPGEPVRYSVLWPDSRIEAETLKNSGASPSEPPVAADGVRIVIDSNAAVHSGGT